MIISNEQKGGIMTCPIVGMSPGNSYFKDFEVSYVLTEVIKLFGYAVIFIPDVPAISTYLGLGYSFHRARVKALSQGRNLKNRVKRITKQLEIPEDKVMIINWETDVSPLSLYIDSYNKVANLWYSNHQFNSDIYTTTCQVLTRAVKCSKSMNESIITATNYLISELAFMEVAPTLFKTEKAIYIYHKEWTIYENYIRGVYDQVERKHLGFFLLPPPKILKDKTNRGS